jgi:hypothetical protein
MFNSKIPPHKRERGGDANFLGPSYSDATDNVEEHTNDFFKLEVSMRESWDVSEEMKEVGPKQVLCRRKGEGTVVTSLARRQ